MWYDEEIELINAAYNVCFSCTTASLCSSIAWQNDVKGFDMQINNVIDANNFPYAWVYMDEVIHKQEECGSGTIMDFNCSSCE